MIFLECPSCGKSNRAGGHIDDDESRSRLLWLTPCEHCGRPLGETPECFLPQDGGRCWLFLTAEVRCSRDGTQPWQNRWISNGRICAVHAAALNEVAKAVGAAGKSSEDIAGQIHALPAYVRARLMRDGSATQEVIDDLLWRNAAERSIQGRGRRQGQPLGVACAYAKPTWIERRRLKAMEKQRRRVAKDAARREEERRRDAEWVEQETRRLEAQRVEEKRQRIARYAERSSEPDTSPTRIPRRALSLAADTDLLPPVLPARLGRAIAADELVLHYQPKFECATGAVVGVEALVRWDRPSHGLLLPAEFLPGLRRPPYSDVLVPLTEWVLVTACRQAGQWKEAGHTALKVTVNVPNAEPVLRSAVEILNGSGIDRSSLEFELSLTGSSDMSVAGRFSSMAEDRWWIDNFGVGQANLGALIVLPVVGLKIPPTLVREIGAERMDAILESVIKAAHELEKRVCAVGVETAEQYEFLKEHHCDEVQGYFFSKPVPPGSLRFDAFA